MEIAELEDRLGSTAAIATGDPGAALVSETLPWLTDGVVRPAEADIRRVRILLLTRLPASADVLLSLAASTRNRT